MTQTERFEAEMMDTPTLANEMRLVKDEIRQYAWQKRILKDDAFAKREYSECSRRWRNAKQRYNELEKIMKSRQMKLF